MTTTPNLGIEHIVPSQYQKETSANVAFNALDGAIAGRLDVSLASGDATVTPDQARTHALLRITGTLPALSALIVPTVSRPYFILHDGTDYPATVRTLNGTGVTLDPGQRAAVYCDGTNVRELIRATPAGSLPVDIAVSLPGLLDPGAVLVRLVMARTLVFAVGLPGSLARAGATPTAEATLLVNRNDFTFATLTFAPGATTATFSAADPVTFAAGDVLSITAPDPADPTLADLSITLIATR